MFRHGYDLRELTVAACRAEGFEPVFAVEGGEMDAVLGFVRAGLGVAVVPRMVAAPVAGADLRVTPLARPGPAPHDRAGAPQRRGAAAGGARAAADAARSGQRAVPARPAAERRDPAGLMRGWRARRAAPRCASRRSRRSPCSPGRSDRVRQRQRVQPVRRARAGVVPALGRVAAQHRAAAPPGRRSPRPRP